MEAVFLDRDGVINENRVDHVKTWQEFQFLPGALEAIVRLSGAGLKVFVITNQAIINRGLVSRSTVDAINRRMVREVWNRGGRIDAVAGAGEFQHPGMGRSRDVMADRLACARESSRN